MPISQTWYKRKYYLHFDLPLGEADATDYVTNPKLVARHAFYPLLTFNMTTPRIRKNPKNKRYRKDPKERPIAYPSHKDGYIFSYYKSLLEPEYEKWLESNGLDECVTTFRKPGKSNVKLAKEAFDFIEKNRGCQILVADIESFFQKIDHKILKDIWARFLNNSRLPEDHYAVYKAVTRYSEVDRHKVYNLFGIRINGKARSSNRLKRICDSNQFHEKILCKKIIRRGKGVKEGIGIPQGTSLSPLLSNMYLADLDLALHGWITSLGGRYWRYCDDILVVVPVNKKTDIKSRLDEELGRLALTRSDPKTQQFCSDELHTSRQLQYLGFVFNGSNSVVRPSSIHRSYRKLSRAIKATVIRQIQEGHGETVGVPFRKQALYNMYSELPLRGKRIINQKNSRRLTRNFAEYVAEAAKTMDSRVMRRQYKRLLRHFRIRLLNRL